MADFEVTLGQYGRMIFEIMAGKPDDHMPEHWKSIEAEARPLVLQLLAINNKMSNGGYNIHGQYVNGKKVLSKQERIGRAMWHDWNTPAPNLKMGDRLWVSHGDIEMDPFGEEPAPVEYIKGEGNERVVGIDRGRDGVYKLGPCDKVLKAPSDYDDREDEYQSDDYWLKRADVLGI